MNKRIGVMVYLLLTVGACARQEEAEMSKTYMDSTLAGAWYEAHSGRLEAELQGYLQAAEPPVDSAIFAVIVPHAGYTYSGPAAAAGIKALLARPSLNRVVVLGFTHRVPLPNRISLPARETHYRSPLGETPLDTGAIATLLKNPLFGDVPATRRGENSVEMQLPLLQAALAGRDWTLVPVTLGQLDDDARQKAAKALGSLLDGRTVLVVSSDFTHFGPNFGYVPFRTNVAEQLRRLDGGAVEQIIAGDAAGFAAYCQKTGATICGQDSIGVLLRMLPKKFRAQELAYDTSGNRTGDYSNSVSYASIAFYEKEAAAFPETAGPATPELSAADRQNLLTLARKAIEQGLKGQKPDAAEDVGVIPTPAMQRQMGGFVTLTINGELRGCIGEIFPRRSLTEVVLEHARNAAFHDPRFPPLTAREFAKVHIEISALTPPVPVASYKEIVIGRHGMTLELGGRSAVFLPQVAPEQGWDLATTLTHLSRKAGLPGDAWQNPRARFTVFEATVFHE
ncbi:MAG: AmmeMemoRadiSam system protein B [Kiritimatiellae bacterium]|nr:AmmeMemoRadiSam system protein B [Kiritimatiellia bacterium]NLD89281.1 AmmeMemoRadiSam system protein B [Lentisphaerota bacterium]HQN80188.1 AmmeMemoRadiSam system protein B [Kiritimatiellia bacterium]